MLLPIDLRLYRLFINANTNVPVRQKFPKHRYLTTITEQEIEKAMEVLIHCPGKSPGIRTSCEVLFKTGTVLTIALQN